VTGDCNGITFNFVQIVEVSYGANLSGFVVSDGDDKEFFCAKDNLYCVKSHKLRLARKGRGSR
jgi:hypothetical protein